MKKLFFTLEKNVIKECNKTLKLVFQSSYSFLLKKFTKLELIFGSFVIINPTGVMRDDSRLLQDYEGPLALDSPYYFDLFTAIAVRLCLWY